MFTDAQVSHVGATARVERPGGGSIEVLAHPVHFSETPTGIRSGPPTAGEHTAEVLRELGI